MRKTCCQAQSATKVKISRPRVRISWVISVARRDRVRGARSERGRAELLLVAMTFDRQRDETIEQRRVVHAARRPQLGVHADRGEAGKGVDLVQIERARGACEQKVHAC